MSDEAPKARINLERAAVLLLSNSQSMELLVRIFRGFGVRLPYRCTDQGRAMEVCRETDLDLIVCDGSLPDGEAYDFITELRRSDMEPNRFTPAIVIQGHTPLDQIAKARDCGANFVVAKPVEPLVLLERIMWIAREQRAFIEMDSYAGPDRRFQSLSWPSDIMEGRRREDRAAAAPRTAVNPEDSLI